ncbi:perlucin-like [Mytilus trossulus]|uniref:perlucin-like n=1 Tax=Mytilus trossulus TaxID=6551 RepID=UPI0030045923
MALNLLLSLFGILVICKNVQADCPNGFTRHDDSCYKAIRIRATWAESTVYCHMFGSELTSIETELENRFVIGMLQNMKGSFNPVKFWLGGSDMAEEGSWVWAKSGQPLTYTNWQHGNPDNGNDGDEHCMDLREDHHWQWGDNNCDEHFYFVCERPLFVGQTVIG